LRAPGRLQASLTRISQPDSGLAPLQADFPERPDLAQGAGTPGQPTGIQSQPDSRGFLLPRQTPEARPAPGEQAHFRGQLTGISASQTQAPTCSGTQAVPAPRASGEQAEPLASSHL
ncbi:hypothetical protein AAFF_G00254000, partial [Aldrovandia affinis]